MLKTRLSKPGFARRSSAQRNEGGASTRPTQNPPSPRLGLRRGNEKRTEGCALGLEQLLQEFRQ
jgi:hypothetical protein